MRINASEVSKKDKVPKNGGVFLTIVDFVNAYHLFLDEEWDGEPQEPIDTGGVTGGIGGDGGD